MSAKPDIVVPGGRLFVEPDPARDAKSLFYTSACARDVLLSRVS
jgi:hypothetical protein